MTKIIDYIAVISPILILLLSIIGFFFKEVYKKIDKIDETLDYIRVEVGVLKEKTKSNEI